MNKPVITVKLIILITLSTTLTRFTRLTPIKIFRKSNMERFAKTEKLIIISSKSEYDFIKL